MAVPPTRIIADLGYRVKVGFAERLRTSYRAAMNRISLALDLRKVLWSISASGGDPSMYVSENHSLLRQLRRHVFTTCDGKEIPLEEISRYRQPSPVNLLERGTFEKHVTFCIIRLRDLGVPEEVHERYIKAALTSVVSSMLKHDEPEQEFSEIVAEELATKVDFDEMVISKIIKCFHPGYYPDTYSSYELLQDHMLVVWSFNEEKWRLTNLGHYALRLNAFSLIVFLISIELTFTGDFRSQRYATETTLQRILDKDAESLMHPRGRYPVSLRWYGVLDYQLGSRFKVTGFGRQVVSSVLNRKDQLNAIVMMLVEADDRGFEIAPDDSSIRNSLSLSRESCALTQSQQQIVEQISQSYERGDYLGALTSFYPLIEGFVDSELQRRGIQGKIKLGMSIKISELVKCQAISSKLGAWGEIVSSRNKIVHGNIMDSDQEVLKPLLAIVSNFWSRLVAETSGAGPQTGN